MNFEYRDLDWQWEQGGMQVINLRVMVCRRCTDNIQPQKRTYIFPPDPEGIEFALPEDYSKTDNPLSPIGYSAISSSAGANIGTLLQAGGLNAAFDGNLRKTVVRCAATFAPISSFQNFIGKDWLPGGGLPPSIFTPLSYSVASFSLYGPTNAALGSSALQLQGSSDGISWVTLYSTTSAGTVGEIINSISSNLTTGNFQQHRIALAGGSNTIAVAQLQFSVATTGINEE